MLGKTLSVVAALLLFTAVSNAQTKTTFSVHGCAPPTAPQGTSTTTGDFNGDGKPDAATASQQSASIEICTNQGSGNFANTAQVPTGSPNQVGTADINKDGKLDLVVANGDTPTLSLYDGAGDGTFAPAGSVVLSHFSNEFALADINNDKIPDLVVQECDYSATPDSCGVRVYKNNGAGIFIAGQQLYAPATNMTETWHSIVAGDFNNDGKIDVIIGRLGIGNLLYRGNGDGTFAAPYSIAPKGWMAVGSFNHDNYLDLVTDVGGPCSSTTCSQYAGVYLNDHTGHFGLRSRTLLYGVGYTVLDLNGDGLLDILSLHGGHFEGGFGYAYGKGDGTFTAQVGGYGGDTPILPSARDMNLDGRHDIVETEYIGGGTAIWINTNAAVICTPPGSARLAAKICSPGSNGTVAKTFTVRGSGNSPAGVQRLELWVDGHKKAEALNDQIKASVTVAAGTHKVTMVAVSQFGSTASKSIFVHAP